MSIVSFNTMNTLCDRLASVSDCFESDDLVVMHGTKQMMFDEEHPVQLTHLHKGCIALQWGWRKSQMGNSGFGITMLVNSRLRHAFMRPYHPPVELSGRAAALHLWNGIEDLMIFGVYMPAGGTSTEDKQHWAIQSILQWMSRILREAPRRPITFLCGDLTADGGELMSGGFGQTTIWTDNASGGLENDTGKLMREWAESHDMVVAITSGEIGGTSFHTNECTNIFLPRSGLDLVQSLQHDLEAMRKLQAMSTSRLREHPPIRICLGPMKIKVPAQIIVPAHADRDDEEGVSAGSGQGLVGQQ